MASRDDFVVDMNMQGTFVPPRPIFIGTPSAREDGDSQGARLLVATSKAVFQRNSCIFRRRRSHPFLSLFPRSFAPPVYRVFQKNAHKGMECVLSAVAQNQNNLPPLHRRRTPEGPRDVPSRRRRHPRTFLPSSFAEKTALASGDQLSSVRGNNKSGDDDDDVCAMAERARERRRAE